MMVGKGNYPQIALIQASELFWFTQMIWYYMPWYDMISYE